MTDILTSKREPITRKWGLSAFDLKCIAMVTMLLDHIGAYIYTDVLWLRIVGRLSFPIFCFLIVEGDSIAIVKRRALTQEEKEAKKALMLEQSKKASRSRKK